MRRYLRQYRSVWWQEGRIWEIPRLDHEDVRKLASQLRLSTLLAKVLCARGLTTPQEARAFLLGTGKDLPEPTALAGVSEAASILADAVRKGVPILVHGDYDADGISATALLASTLAKLGGKAAWFVPNRIQDGYGVSTRAINMAKQKGIKLLVTLDCGIHAHQAIELAKSYGMKVIVVDHHESPEQLPPADVIVNPKLEESRYRFRDLCAGALALKVAQATAEAMGRSVPVNELPIELAAIATAADVVPLVDENRLIVREGLKVLRSARHLGLKALMEVARIDHSNLQSFHLSFIIAPRINAVGRMDDPKPALRLLLTTDRNEAYQLATKLDEENRKRQREEELTLRMAVEMVDKELDLSRERVIVLASPEWHPGVIGIVAARLVELYSRPAFLIAIKGNIGKGSARSIDNFPISDALKVCKPVIINGGGHKAAGGFTIPCENIPLFRDQLNALAEAWLTEEDLMRRIRVDAVVSAEEVNLVTVKELEALEPTGYGNPKPVLMLQNAKLVYAEKSPSQGNSKLIVRVQQGNKALEMRGDGMGGLANELKVGVSVHVCFTADIKPVGGIPTLDLQIVDIAPVDTQQVVFRQL
ncbi:MAG: single-stranded-DNA-specific exonuclease RecJ [Armatimonadetes bacterium]|nr:single-stranded-DNA-specific exonuclease RecJ [Armatimonadota bacterium]MCX7968218.1 single-stranded-DNA-specific exonuclease RecJ [Armatimonadota bacterium]MDW8143362.1 single-stranded-DNA-specific exonuclease RecJ [Armatimonadota bacterium]